MSGNKIKILNKFSVAILLVAVFVFGLVGPIEATTIVDFGTADSFAVLAGSGITNTGSTTINGDVGSSPTPTQSGFGSVTLNGINHFGDGVTQSAQIDLTAAYIDAAGRGPTSLIAADLGGQTLPPGIYKDNGAPASLSISGTLTLDGNGDANAVFIFQSATTLTTSSASVVQLINGAKAENIFWQVGSSAILGANSTFKGNLIVLSSVTIVTGANVEGRVLAQNGAVTLDSNIITVPADTISPVAISNLALSSPTTSSIVLTWTAPGDDTNVGTATLYDIRYSTSPIITAADFTGAALVSGEPVPTAAGTSQTKTVSGLSANTTYYFAMKTQDEVPNISEVSNIPSLATAAMPDIIPPAAISDLALSGATTSSIILTWTAPGDDTNVGTATLYDIRYDTSPIVTSADFTGAALVSGEPVPTAAGTSQTKTVSGLSANTTYYFAMKTQDEVPNISEVSNIPSLATAAMPDIIPPAAISDLALSGATTSSIVLTWTAPGDDTNVGTATLYDIRYDTSPIVTSADFTGASLVSSEPVPTAAGTSQTKTVSGLSANTTYYFAMKTQDEVPNISEVSNIPSLATAATPTGGSSSTIFTGTINVVKTVFNDNGGTKKVEDFPLFINGTPVTSGITNNFSFYSSGTYTVSETVDFQYTQTFSGDCDANGIVYLHAAENLFCIITNNDIGAPVVVSLVPPLIDIVKTANPLLLPDGPGLVSYSYILRNIGTVPITGITMVGDTCFPITLTSGDLNLDAKLDLNETWVYNCSKTISETHTNTVVATGWANGLSSVDIASATVFVNEAIVPPLIHVTKIPNPLTLLAGGGNVTYTETITNPGIEPLNNVTLSDNKCSPVAYVSGDTNNDSKLDSTEAWKYICQTKLTATTTSTATASGEANGLTVRDLALATVTVASAVPALPMTGFFSGGNGVLWATILLAGVFMLILVSRVGFKKNKI